MRIILFFSFALITQSIIAQCDEVIDGFSLGSDTTICNGNNYYLVGSPMFSNYLWSTGNTNDSLLVSQTGSFSLSAYIFDGVNLVLNGNFESGIQNFNSDYSYGTSGAVGILSYEGTYAITNSPANGHINFENCSDHTSGGGLMLVANGSSDSNTTVWEQNINVLPGIDYIFSFWETNVLNSVNVSNLQLYINNIPISQIVSTTEYGCDWIQNSGIWNSGNSTTANLRIVNQSTVASGNDFAIDDILFSKICVVKDTINIVVEEFEVNLGDDIIACDNDLVFLNTTSIINISNWNWSDNSVSSSLEIENSGAYWVECTSINGCLDSDTIVVTLATSPNSSFTANTLVGYPPLEVNFINNSSNSTNYIWNFDDIFINTSYDSSQNMLFDNIGMHEVILIAQNGICLDTSFLYINVLPPKLKSEIQVYNVFTPNNDGENDVYHLGLLNINSIEWTIFNRWGEVVFSTNDIDEGWDGTNKLKEKVTDGVYYYVYNAYSIYEEPLNGSGYLHLLR